MADALPESTLAAMAALFSAVADASRLRLLLHLRAGEHRSGDLAAALEMTPSAISHQLRWLREHGIVQARKAGREVYYCLTDDCIRDLLSTALAHVQGEHAP
ncbi:MAG: helix-turn-helix transcriptional regulator [Anaerolineae bacterium]|nr:helix-turn-helix transcriptional regulator [Anaerolineae bacterium]